MQQYNLLSKMKNQSKLTSSNTPFKIKEQLNRESIQQQQFSKDNLVDSFLSPWESKKINEYNFKEMPKNLVQGKIKSQRIFSRIKNTENDAVKRFEKRYKIYDGDKITKKNELNFIRSPIKITKENVRSNILELKRQLTPQKTYYQTNYAGQLSKYHNHNKSQSLNKFNRVKGNQDSSSYIKKYCLSNADLPNNHTFDLFMIPRKKNQIQSQNTKVPRNKVANILRRRIQSRVQRNTKELTIGKVEIDLQNLLNQENKFRILNTSHHQQRIFSLDLRI